MPSKYLDISRSELTKILKKVVKETGKEVTDWTIEIAASTENTMPYGHEDAVIEEASLLCKHRGGSVTRVSLLK